jgi:hypothetical protein
MVMRKDANSVSRSIAALSNQTQSTSVRFVLAAVVVLLGGATFVLARDLAPNSGNGVPSTLGTASVTTCSNEPVLTLIPTVTGGVERIGEISLDNIPIQCAGKSLVVEFRSEENLVLDRVVWSLALMSLSDTSISARANGTQIATANASESNISVNYPAIETGSSGLDSPSLSSTVISSFTITATDSVVSE